MRIISNFGRSARASSTAGAVVTVLTIAVFKCVLLVVLGVDPGRTPALHRSSALKQSRKHQGHDPVLPNINLKFLVSTSYIKHLVHLISQTSVKDP